MVARRHEEDVVDAGIVELFDGFDDVDDRGAGTDADVPGFGVEMFLHCQLGGGSFGGLNG